MSKLILAPFGIVAGLVAGQLAKKLFDLAWARVSQEEAPRPDQRDAGWARLVTALVVEGAIFRLTKGVVDRMTRSGYARLTGSWPGEEGPDPA